MSSTAKEATEQPASKNISSGKDVSSMSPEEIRTLLGEMSALTKALSSLSALDEKKETSKDDEDEDEWHSPFADSCYTLIYMCDKTTHGFWHGLFVIGLQICTIGVTLVDIVDWSEGSGNPLKIPPMVNITVTVAQAFALYLSVAFQQDLIQAVLKFHDGFYPEVLETHPEANKLTWFMSCLLQLIAGMLLLVTIFILTMQAENVIGIMLNFAALRKSIFSRQPVGFYFCQCFLTPTGFTGP